MSRLGRFWTIALVGLGFAAATAWVFRGGWPWAPPPALRLRWPGYTALTYELTYAMRGKTQAATLAAPGKSEAWQELQAERRGTLVATVLSAHGRTAEVLLELRDASAGDGG